MRKRRRYLSKRVGRCGEHVHARQAISSWRRYLSVAVQSGALRCTRVQSEGSSYMSVEVGDLNLNLNLNLVHVG